MILKSVVATKIRKINPAADIKVFVANDLKPQNVCCICMAPSCPNILVRDKNNFPLRLSLLNTSPIICTKIMRIAGKAKVVKKAVAPASRKGSFCLNSL